jgi:hypothetical protein
MTPHTPPSPAISIKNYMNTAIYHACPLVVPMYMQDCPRSRTLSGNRLEGVGLTDEKCFSILSNVFYSDGIILYKTKIISMLFSVAYSIINSPSIPESDGHSFLYEGVRSSNLRNWFGSSYIADGIPPSLSPDSERSDLRFEV